MLPVASARREKEGQFKCLPYFQILGVSKCGTTDLYNRLTEHPDMVDCGWKVGQRACGVVVRQWCGGFRARWVAECRWATT